MTVEAARGRVDGSDEPKWQTVHVPNIGDVDYSVTTISHSLHESGCRGTVDGMTESTVGGNRISAPVRRQQIAMRYLGHIGMAQTAAPTRELAGKMTVHDDEARLLAAHVDFPLTPEARASAEVQAAIALTAFGTVVRHLTSLPEGPRDPLTISLAHGAQN